MGTLPLCTRASDRAPSPSRGQSWVTSPEGLLMSSTWSGWLSEEMGRGWGGGEGPWEGIGNIWLWRKPRQTRSPEALPQLQIGRQAPRPLQEAPGQWLDGGGARGPEEAALFSQPEKAPILTLLIQGPGPQWVGGKDLGSRRNWGRTAPHFW